MGRKKKSRLSFIKDSYAVSETLGSLLMVVLAVSLTTSISLIIFNPWVNFSAPEQRFASLSGYVSGDTVVLQHMGGEPIPVTGEIQVELRRQDSPPAPVKISYLLSDYFSQIGNSWTTGEVIRIDYSAYPDYNGLTDTFVQAVIVDRDINQVIFDKVLQEMPEIPYIVAFQPVEETVSETSVELKLFYDFLNSDYLDSADAEIRFILEAVDEADPDPFVVTPETFVENTIIKNFDDLIPETEYHFQGEISYTDPETGNPASQQSEVKTFWTYGEYRAQYLFETYSDNTIKDEINPKVDGVGYGVERSGDIAPQVPLGSHSLQFEIDANDKDYVKIPHHNKFNISNGLRISAYIKTDYTDWDFQGKINLKKTEIIQNPGFIDECKKPDMVYLSGDSLNAYYAVVCEKTPQPCIFTIEVNLQTNDVRMVGSLSLKNITYNSEPCILKINGDIYAVAFGVYPSSGGFNGWTIATFDISSDGDTINKIDNVSFDTGSVHYGSEPNLVHVEGERYAIIFGGQILYGIHNGRILTIQIKDDGEIIQNSVISLQYSSWDYCLEPDIIFVKKLGIGNVFLILYSESKDGDRFYSKVKTIVINAEGEINLDLFSYSDAIIHAKEPKIYQIKDGLPHTDSIFAVVYGKGSYSLYEKGCLQTIGVKSDGSPYSIDNYLFSDAGTEADIVHVGDDIYMVGYSSFSDSTSKLSTFTINESGDISEYPLDTYSFSTLPNRLEPSLIQLAENKVLSCFGDGITTHGFFAINEVLKSGALHTIISKPGSYELLTDSIHLIGKVTLDNDEECSVMGDLPQNWVLIGLSFYGEGSTKTLKLEIDEENYERQCFNLIKKTNAPLQFGPFIGYLDNVNIKQM